MTIALVIIIALHGLIHLIGFVKEFKLAEVKQISGPKVSATTGKLLGAMWLAATVLFFVLAVAILQNTQWAAIVGIAAVVVSQILLIIYWKDAKFGTIANLLIITYIIIHYYL